MPNFHIADVTGVHAEDARDGRERQEDDGYYREGVYETFLAVFLDVYFVTVLEKGLSVSELGELPGGRRWKTYHDPQLLGVQLVLVKLSLALVKLQDTLVEEQLPEATRVSCGELL